MKNACLMVIILVFATSVSVSIAGNMDAFAPAKNGMTRHVLELPGQTDESKFKVQLIIGKTVRIDKGNRYFFGGKIVKETIKGWGFTRYVVSKLGSMAGTLMAVDPNVPKVDRFITLGGRPYLIPYNSRLPVVVYVPEGVEVRYQIWSAAGEIRPIEEG